MENGGLPVLFPPGRLIPPSVCKARRKVGVSAHFARLRLLLACKGERPLPSEGFVCGQFEAVGEGVQQLCGRFLAEGGGGFFGGNRFPQHTFRLFQGTRFIGAGRTAEEVAIHFPCHLFGQIPIQVEIQQTRQRITPHLRSPLLPTVPQGGRAARAGRDRAAIWSPPGSSPASPRPHARPTLRHHTAAAPSSVPPEASRSPAAPPCASPHVLPWRCAPGSVRPLRVPATAGAVAATDP